MLNMVVEEAVAVLRFLLLQQVEVPFMVVGVADVVVALPQQMDP
jgi:hypothetical protein